NPRAPGGPASKPIHSCHSSKDGAARTTDDGRRTTDDGRRTTDDAKAYSPVIACQYLCSRSRLVLLTTCYPGLGGGQDLRFFKNLRSYIPHGLLWHHPYFAKLSTRPSR